MRPGIFFEKPVLLLSALYTLAWGPMLFMRGAYWDGWVFFAQFTHSDYAWIYAVFAPPRNYFHYYTFRILDVFPDPTLAGRSIVFFSWLLSGLLLFHILRRFLSWDTYTATLCVAYYLIYPVFIVRFEFIHMYYSAITLFFTLGCFLFLDPTPHSRIVTFLREATACALFFLAFLFNSFLVFFFGFLAVHFFLFSQKQPKLTLFATALQWLRRFWYLLLFPFVFMATKTLFLPRMAYMPTTTNYSFCIQASEPYGYSRRGCGEDSIQDSSGHLSRHCIFSSGSILCSRL